MYPLQKLIKKTDIIPRKNKHINVRGLTCDSRRVRPGDLFFAVSGYHYDGNAFIADAFKRGAAAVITEKSELFVEAKTHPVLITRDMQASMAGIAQKFFGDPSRRLSTIGITGTNGKTTITYFLENICRGAHISCGVIGTVNYRYGRKSMNARNTTPQVIDLQRLLYDMHAHRVQKVFMEVSSHALALKRVEGIRFTGAVFTNLTRDHLDFHHTMEDYFQAKSILFKEMSRKKTGNNGQKKFAIINTDDPHGKRMRSYCSFPVITYGMRHRQDVRASSLRLSPEGSSFTLHLPGSKMPVRLHLIGEYNVYNALAAAGTALALGISKKKIIEGLETLHGVPGRMEKVLIQKPYTVIVDYAHTGDALENVLRALHRVKPKRILTVFGCGGDRDRVKRPIMGRIAVQQSHHAWVTLDNPRSEDPGRIMDDIVAGIRKARKRNYTVVYDRKQAIAEAVSRARAGDVVLIAGKGHEQYQILKDKTIPFDDKKVVREIVRA